MAKRKRFRKRTVFGSIEGEKVENNFLIYLKEIYLDESHTSFKIHPYHGGSPERSIEIARKNLHCGFDRLFVWIDEDLDLSLEAREILSDCWGCSDEDGFMSCLLRDLQSSFNPLKKNPILIVSQPVCVESLILRVLGHTPGCLQYNSNEREKQIRRLKDSFSGVIRKMDHLQFYKENLSKQLLEAKRMEIPELDLLILMITG